MHPPSSRAKKEALIVAAFCHKAQQLINDMNEKQIIQRSVNR